MKLAIAYAVSSYKGSLSALPGCDNDRLALSTLLHQSHNYSDILEIPGEATSHEAKSAITDFITKHRADDVEELFFYYSGHGMFDGDDFYFLPTDYDKAKKKQTSIGNNELDQQLRSLNPALAFKVVDACHSGIPYVKDETALDQYLKGTKGQFGKCYFAFSSQVNQASYQDSAMSFFTKALIKSLATRSSSTVRYKDVFDFISDEFLSDKTQKPFFLVQGDFTEIYLTAVPQQLSDALTAVLPGASGSKTIIEDGDAGAIAGEPDTLVSLVAKDAKRYFSREEAMKSLEEAKAVVLSSHLDPDLEKLFEVKIDFQKQSPQYLSRLESVAYWLDKNRHYFATVEMKKVREERKPSYLDKMMRLGLSANLGEEKEVYTHLEPHTFYQSTEQPFYYLTIGLSPRHENLTNYCCWIIPILSKTHICFVYAVGDYIPKDWGKTELLEDEIRWTIIEIKIGDKEMMKAGISKIFNEYSKHVVEALKKRFTGPGEGEKKK